MRSLHVVFAGVTAVLVFLVLLVAVILPSETHAIQQRTKVYTLTLGHGSHQYSVVHQAALRFAEQVYTTTEGRVEINIHARNVVGSDHAMMERVRLGELDFAVSSTSALSVSAPSFLFTDLPFYFSSDDERFHLLDTQVGIQLMTELSLSDIQGLGFWQGGPKYILSDEPLLDANAFIGKRVKVTNSRLARDTIRALGAQPIPIDRQATLVAYIAGHLDAVELNAESAIELQRELKRRNLSSFKHLSATGHGFSSLALVASSKTMRTLPENLQLSIAEAARVATQWQREQSSQVESQFIRQLESLGLKIDVYSEHQKRALADKLAGLVDKYESVIGADIYVKAEQYFFDEYGPLHTDTEHYLVGINASFNDETGSGLALKRGLALAVDEINDQGGLLGKPLYLLAKDHKHKESLRHHNRKLLSQRLDAISVFTDVQGEGLIDRGGRVNRDVMRITVDTDEISRLAHAHTLSLTGTKEIREQAAHLLIETVTERGHVPVIVAESMEWSRGLLKSVERSLAKQGKTPAAALIMNQESPNFHRFISDAVNLKTDHCIILMGSTDFTESVLMELRLSQVKMHVLGVLNEPSIHLFEQNKAIAMREGLSFLTTDLAVDASQMSFKDVRMKLRKRFSVKGEVLSLEAVAIDAYQKMMAIADAAEVSGSLKHSALAHLLDKKNRVESENKQPEQFDVAQVNSGQGLFLAKFNAQGELVRLAKEN